MTIRQRWCALRGHVDELVLRSGFVGLRCRACGYESAGWAWAIRSCWSANVLRFKRRWKAAS